METQEARQAQGISQQGSGPELWSWSIGLHSRPHPTSLPLLCDLALLRPRCHGPSEGGGDAKLPEPVFMLLHGSGGHLSCPSYSPLSPWLKFGF